MLKSYRNSVSKRFASGDHLTHDAAAASAAPLTMACWFNTTSVALINGLMSIFTSGSPDHRFTLTTETDSTISFNCRDTANNAVASTNTLVLNSWNLAVAVTASATSRTIYLNGVQGSTSTTSRTPTGMNRTGFGRIHDTTTPRPLTGQIAWPAVWSAALTARDVARLYGGSSPLRVRQDNLVSFWDFIGASIEASYNGSYPLTASGTFAMQGPSHLRTVTPRNWVLSSVVSAASTIPVFAHHYQQQGIA